MTASSTTVPPSDVNLTTFESRLSRIWCSRAASTLIVPMPGAGWQSTETLVTAAVGRTESQAARSAEATSTIEGCMRSSPATASEVSSRSSTSRDCAWALR